MNCFCYKLRVLLLLLLIIVSKHTIWANYNYKFQKLSVDEGLKNSRVVSVIQDKDGFMWFATHNGVDKFNGSDIKHYSMSLSAGLFSNDDIINCLELSDHYNILCGTKNGNLYAYNRQIDSFYKVLPFEHSDALFNIHAIYSDNEAIWIGTTGGLFHFDIKTAELKPVSDVKQGVRAIIAANDKQIWVGSSNGLKLINKENKQLVKTTLTNAQNTLLDDTNVMSLHLENDTLLVGSRSSEAYKLLCKNSSLSLLSAQNFNNGFKDFPVTDIISSPDQEHYAVALDGVGLFICDRYLKPIEAYTADDNDVHSLSSNGVYELYYSHDNILWVATYGGGINLADPNKKQFNIYQRIPHIHNSLRNNAVNAILENEGELWFGTKRGISIFNQQQNQWRHIPALKKSMQKPFHVMAMCKGKDTSIWVATYGRGLIKINPTTNRKQYINKSSTGNYKTETNHLYQVICDSEGRIWAGGIWGQVSVIDESKKQSRMVNISNIRSFGEYKDQVFIGTLFGLFIVDKETLEVSRPSHSLLIKSRIICINTHPSENKVYLGTDVNGLLEWDMTTDSIKQYNKHQLPSSYIRSVIWDREENMWVSSTGGLSFYNDSSELFDNYNNSDGLANTEFSENAACLHSSGQLIFGGPKGISWFYPENITKSTQSSLPKQMAPKPKLNEF